MSTTLTQWLNGNCLVVGHPGQWPSGVWDSTTMQCQAQGCPNVKRSQCVESLESQQPNGGGEPGPVHGPGVEQWGSHTGAVFEDRPATSRNHRHAGASEERETPPPLGDCTPPPRTIAPKFCAAN
ncbi:hypothetical protein L3Y34_002232 [Caenorhabditis briggsae]|uniref:Uncharacterized protein n=1 Tax=Caenorhabditis briggsae TaxID=6238 RepID=A0AAE9IR72_CAEBR|nr:hypothetical protein L3Y34_002232 [Caenorhabditis briggsae]